MKLIIGGAYQGKREFAQNTFGFGEGDIFTCEGIDMDFSCPCIDKIEEFTLACVREGKDPIAVFAENRASWQSSVLICQDIFCGVVPMEAEMRAWRNLTGQLCQYLSREAEQVSRIFCGLEQRLK